VRIIRCGVNIVGAIDGFNEKRRRGDGWVLGGGQKILWTLMSRRRMIR
jgi:hypothetical protein